MIPATLRVTHPPDWRQQWREAITDPAELLAELGLDACRLGVASEDPPHGFALRVPRAFVARMGRGAADDPLLRQVLPLDDECRTMAGYGLDPVGDLAARAAPGDGLLHKYEGRALLVATGSCAVHCRYCFRRHFPYASGTAARDQWSSSIEWLHRHPGVDEVILSGGDPLSLSTQKLAELTRALAGMPQVKTLRIHTRLPVVLPARVDAELVAWLQGLRCSKVVVIHANHAQEFDDEVDAAMLRMRDAGCMLLNQSVLLRGVNDSIEALAALSRRLLRSGVIPYYLHALDPVAGAAHFAVDDALATRLVDGLREVLPGYLVPRLVREIEGAASKTPLS